MTDRVETALKKRRKTAYIPYRYIIIFMLAICAIIAYGTRISFKLSLRHMTTHMVKKTIGHPPRCNSSNSNYTFFPLQVNQKFFKWPKKILPKYSDAFIWSYIISHFPAGVVSVKYGGKTLLSVSLLVLCCFTLLTPTILFQITDSTVYVLFYRVMAGASCGALFPCMNALIGNWIPCEDRGKMASMIYAGNSIAAGINLLLGNLLIIKTNTWSCVYYFYGSLLATWLFFWHIFGSSFYQNTLRVSRKELKYLQDKMHGHVTMRPKTIPWWKMLTSMPLWALTLNEFGHQIIFRLISKELPNFLREDLGIPTNVAYELAAIPFLLVGLFTILNGFLSDFIINGEYVNLTTYRKICTTLGGVGPCLNLVVAYYAGCNKNTALFILFFGISLMSFYYAGTRVNTLDLAPNFSGLIMGITSGFGSLSGVFTMIMLQAYNLRNNLEGWKHLFWTSLALIAFANFIYSIFGSGEVQQWNEVEEGETHAPIARRASVMIRDSNEETLTGIRSSESPPPNRIRSSEGPPNRMKSSKIHLSRTRI